MNTIRRKFLKSAMYIGASASAIGAGILAPGRTFAAYATEAFSAKDISGALTAAVGSDAHTASSEIKIKAPDIAENGAVVPVTVSSTLPNVESITIIASANATPLTSTYTLPSGTEAFVSTRIKMGKTANVLAVVKSNGQLFSTSKEVKVTIGGCGG
jgi:sulfur-oxidizing protein SoxY